MSTEVEHQNTAWDRERVSEIIWKHIGLKSVREIAELTGLKPEEVLRRKNELLDEIDVLTVREKQARILVELDGMSREMRERARNTIDEVASGMVNSAVAALKTMLQQLDRLKKQDDGEVATLNMLRQKELLRLVNETVQRSLTEIAATHHLDKQDLLEVFQGHLVEAAREIENNF